MQFKLYLESIEDENGFLDKIFENYPDTTTIQVFCDWLEENNPDTLDSYSNQGKDKTNNALATANFIRGALQRKRGEEISLPLPFTNLRRLPAFEHYQGALQFRHDEHSIVYFQIKYNVQDRHTGTWTTLITPHNWYSGIGVLVYAHEKRVACWNNMSAYAPSLMEKYESLIAIVLRH